MKSLLLLFSIAVGGWALPSPGSRAQPKCGYESCTQPRDGVLNIHIVPHTHDDVGWLKTVDQYYYGNRNNIQKAGVQYILDSVVKELWEDPARRFIYVEAAFLSKWWSEQTDDTQAKVRTLVAEGRLKFVGGAWSMNDEAATYYQSTIDQFTFGLDFLNRTFGECGRPRVGWQIDPFGHSRELASLLAGMGYDGLFLGRIDYRDKSTRMRERTMEFVWRGDDNIGKQSDIFTSILYNTYSPPPGFCFDVLCNDEPIVDDPSSPDYNVDRRVSDFIEYAINARTNYRTDNVLITMGGDFTYQDAGMWYKNLDKLIKYGNKKAEEEKLNVTLFYSTPDCYLKAVKDANPKLPIKQDDFFPYASDPHSYWTGYFTSRPNSKFLEAEANRYLQMVKQLSVLTDLPNDYASAMHQLKAALGILQHHDAITGTEKQHVTSDYVRLTTKALNDAHGAITNMALNKMINPKYADVKLQFDRCKFNESSCATSEDAEGDLMVTVYNPLAWGVVAPITIPTKGADYEVRDTDGNWHKAQTSPIPSSVFRIPSRKSSATHEATFVASLPPLGYKTFYMRQTSERTKRQSNRPLENNNLYGIFDPIIERADAVIIDSRVRGDLVRERVGSSMMADDPMVVEMFSDDQDISMLDASVSTYKVVLTNLTTYTMRGGAAYYSGYLGNNNVFENRSSGAYIFRPEFTSPTDLRIQDLNNINGDVFQEARVAMSDNAEFGYRTYKHSGIEYCELDWIVGPITDVDGVGKEYVFKYETNMLNNGELYTDSNGRQVLKRLLNKRPQYNITSEEPVAANYYPIVDYAYIKDSEGKFSLRILPDRPEGGASLVEGGVEIMLHRRLLHDDSFGVGEALNETEGGKGLIARGTHRIYFDSKDSNFKEVIEMRHRPQVFVTDAGSIGLDKFATFTTEDSWLKAPLPEGVHLLTLEPLENGKFLMRFENYLDKADDSVKTVDISNVLKNVEVKSFKETLLAADRTMDGYNKWTWDTNEEFVDNFNNDFGRYDAATKSVERVRRADDGFRVNLDAKQIRTFIVDYQRST